MPFFLIVLLEQTGQEIIQKVYKIHFENYLLEDYHKYTAILLVWSTHFGYQRHFATQFIVAILPDFLISFWFALLLVLPFITLWLLKSNILNDQLKEKIFTTIENVSQGKIKINRDLNKYVPYTRIPLYFGIAILGWRLADAANFGFGTPILAWIILFAIYVYIFMDIVGRRHAFSLQIGSKTMKESGIFIPGDSLQLLPGRNTTALQGLGGGPAEDSEQVLRELGALLLDIHQLGDLGIEKWKK
jgi:hypothetical protein